MIHSWMIMWKLIKSVNFAYFEANLQNFDVCFFNQLSNKQTTFEHCKITKKCWTWMNYNVVKYEGRRLTERLRRWLENGFLVPFTKNAALVKDQRPKRPILSKIGIAVLSPQTRGKVEWGTYPLQERVI